VMMNTIVQGLVLLQFVEYVVMFVAMYCLPESPVYQRAQAEPLKIDKAMAEFGVRTALACQAFKAWDTHADHEEGQQPEINEQELMDVFKGHFDDKTTQHFVNVIMKEARGPQSDSENLSCRDLVRIMSSGLVSVEELVKLESIREAREQKELAKKLNDESTKVSPADEEDLEKPNDDKAPQELQSTKASPADEQDLEKPNDDKAPQELPKVPPADEEELEKPKDDKAPQDLESTKVSPADTGAG